MTQAERLLKFKSLNANDFFANKGVKVFHAEKQIRKRTSYMFWRPIVEEINANNSNTNMRNNILKNMWNQMDKRCFFGSFTQANYYLESLALCTKDCDNGHWREK
jgi:hypothetical protein